MTSDWEMQGDGLGERDEKREREIEGENPWKGERAVLLEFGKKETERETLKRRTCSVVGVRDARFKKLWQHVTRWILVSCFPATSVFKLHCVSVWVCVFGCVLSEWVCASVSARMCDTLVIPFTSCVKVSESATSGCCHVHVPSCLRTKNMPCFG